MRKISSATESPLRFCSPGLAKALLRYKICTAEQAAAAEKNRENHQLITHLLEHGITNEQSVAKMVVEGLKIPHFTFQGRADLSKMADRTLLARFDREFVLRHRVLPVKVEDGNIVVALSDPLDIESVNQIKSLLSTGLTVVFAFEQDIVFGIELLFQTNFREVSDQAGKGSRVTDMATEDVVVAVAEAEAKGKTGAEAAPIIKLVNKIMADASAFGASDVHIEPSAGNLEIRLRIDGVMNQYLTLPKKIQPYVLTRLKLLSGMDITERRKPQDGRFRIQTGADSNQDIRASSVPTPFGEKLVLRLLRSSFEGLDFDSLGIPPQIRAGLERALAGSDRIFIVTGPTGSGKTTSLYAALNYLKNGRRNIITIEDPIEFRVAGTTQIQVDPKAGVTFGGGLRSILRQDPDVILVGEIRDLETAEISFQAAQTGHLVLTTLHTNSAAAAITRLRDLGMESFVIAASLNGILAQRLVRKLCSACFTPFSDAERLKWEAFHAVALPKAGRSAGCSQCEMSGFRGRIGVYSLLELTPEIRRVVRSNGSEQEIEAAAAAFHDLWTAGLELAADGQTTLEELDRVLGLREAPLSDVKPESTPAAGRPAPVPQAPARQAIVPPSIDSAADPAETRSITDLALSHNRDVLNRRIYRILVVDDDEGVRSVMARALRKSDFDVIEVSDGTEAVEFLEKEIPDVILCDLIMPGMDGWRLVDHLKSTERLKDIPVLMLTGADDEQNEIALLSAGVQDFISKASSPAKVLARINRALTGL